MTPIGTSAVQVTLSGRELALQRRQVMALQGKAGASVPAAARRAGVAASRPAMAVSRLATNQSAAVPAAGASAARQRRQALSQSGKAALPVKAWAPAPTAPRFSMAAPQPESAETAGCGCQGGDACEGGAVGVQGTSFVTAGLSPSATSSVREPLMAVSSDLGSSRALARDRRQALATGGKTGLHSAAQAQPFAASVTAQPVSFLWEAGATGRQKAMQRRLALSRAGRVEADSEARPTGRLRARSDAPAPPMAVGGASVASSPSASAPIDRSKKVTGIEPGRSGKVTGDETGACLAITGTEFLRPDGAVGTGETRPVSATAKLSALEMGAARGKSAATSADHRVGSAAVAERLRFSQDACAPGFGARGPKKVVVTHTSHGKPVSGTAIGHTDKITGDENGACRGITGTEYLAVEQFQSICGTAAPLSPRKVSVMSSRSSQTVSGTEVGRSSKVTGDEPGSCRAITGSQYYTPESFGALCETSFPSKVASMQTSAGRTLTGTELGRNTRMTGGEQRGGTPVTGTEYTRTNQPRAVGADGTTQEPFAKVAIDHTWRGQAVSGSYVGRSTRVTGDEPGGCAPISGTPYIGRGQYNNFCAAPATQAQEALIQSRALIPSSAVTGDRPGAGGHKTTGDERGACEAVSGTPYIGADNSAKSCATSGRFVSRTSSWVEPPRAPAPVDFSISTPARAAQQRRSTEVSGSSAHSERITGPINKADGLITGTPEFRHRDAASSQAEQEAVITAASRLTGEGSQAGRPVTGDAWSALSKVTGTEGASSLSRNPSARGNPRGMGMGMGMGAAQFREAVVQPEVPESRITGSSGNTGRGALVTLSGGARG